MSELATGEPVKGFPLKFTWHTGDWERIFDAQVELIRSDIARARVDGRLVLYLSCPISSRGGGWAGTNVDIARHVERRILDKFGESFWVLNPAQYQLESKAGTGLLVAHAKRLNIDLEQLRKHGNEPTGGDYLRMWTKVLVEGEGLIQGRNFDAFYFLGPRDVHSFFLSNGDTTLTAGIFSYFARKHATDFDFRMEFSADLPDSTGGPTVDNEKWIRRRREFLRFYGLRASAAFSLGCRDEWTILRLINQERRRASTTPSTPSGDAGEQLAAYFDGEQIPLASLDGVIATGYAV